MPDPERRGAIARRVAAAWDPDHAEQVFRGGRVLLPTGELALRDVAVLDGRIVAVAQDLASSGTPAVDLTGSILVPAYVEPHAHIFGPLSVSAYVGHAIARGTGTIMSDDSFTYSFLEADQHAQVLDVSARLPVQLLWSLRADHEARRFTLAELIAELPRHDVAQVGEILVRAALTTPEDSLLEVLAAAERHRLRIEGHAPGASARTLGVAAAAGITADHESMKPEDVIERLRAGLFVHLRHNGILDNIGAIMPELVSRGISLERVGFTVDWSLPPWMAEHGTIDAAIRAALKAGVSPEQAYLSATARPAAYLRREADVGFIAPGRFASMNVLHDLSEPDPARVYLNGVEMARDGALLKPVADVDWDAVSPPRWTDRRTGPPASTYRLDGTEPEVVLENSSLVRPGSGGRTGPITGVALDGATGEASRAAVFGWPSSLRAIVSTLTPLRLLMAVGGDPEALARSVNAVIGAGGGIAFEDDAGLHVLPLTVGGAISREPFDTVARFWARAEAHLASLGHPYPDPLATLLYMATESLPGARFTGSGVMDTKTRTVLAPTFTPDWPDDRMNR